MNDVAHAAELVTAGTERSFQLLELAERLEQPELEAPSDLPGWSRLTIVCHLRYGTRAFLRMSRDALANRATSYYPDGRDKQRPATLRPAPGESPGQVLDDWRSAAEQLDHEWAELADERWRITVVEPAGNPDLGPLPLARLALARLTEVDVHATDLGIGAPDWSQTLVRVGLPTRLNWLNTRRTNHRDFDAAIRGSWRLDATDGLCWFVEVHGGHVTSRPALDSDETTAAITASSRDLLALLLGRRFVAEPVLSGDVAFAQLFQRAFPGP